MEDDSSRYGFPITLTAVKDTLILTSRRNLEREPSFADILLLLSDLRNFVAVNRIPASSDYFYASVMSSNSDFRQLAVGIPVPAINNHLKGFEVLKLPSKGRLLSGIYRGAYDERYKLYDAMDKYIREKRLKKVAQPLEKYYFSDTALSADTQINMSLYYPVY